MRGALRPHLLHLLLERLERELERGARVRDLEPLEHGGVQDAEHPDLEVVRAAERSRSAVGCGVCSWT